MQPLVCDQHSYPLGSFWLLLWVCDLLTEPIQFVGLFNCCDVFLRYERKVHFSEATKFCRLHQDDHYYGLHFLGYWLVRGSKQLVSSHNTCSFIRDQPGVGLCFNKSVCFSLSGFWVRFFIAKWPLDHFKFKEPAFQGTIEDHNFSWFWQSHLGW